MIRTTWRRRAATTMVASASALALAAPSVSAAPGAGPDQFAGRAEALALDLDLALPGELLNGQADKIEQLVSQTLTRLDSEGKVAAKADLLEGLLDTPALEFTGGSKSGHSELASLSEAPVSVRAGTLEYTADAEKRLTRAFSELLDLKVGLKQTDDVEDAVTDATTTLKELVGEPGETAAPGAPVQNLNLNQLLERIETEAKTAGTPITIPDIVPTQLVQLPDTADLTSLATVTKLWSETITQTEAANDTIASTAKGGVVGMSLLGGLVKVPDFEFSSLAKTNGKPGGAVAEAKTKKLEVELAGNPVLGIEGDQLTINGKPLNLPANLDLDTELSELEELLNSILNAVGLDIDQAKETEQAAADGSYALASTSPFAISLSPLNVLRGTQDPAPGTLNLALSLLPTLAEVRADNVAPAAQPKKPQAPAVSREAPGPSESLPRTGGGAVAVLLGGLALGGAFALRRFTKS